MLHQNIEARIADILDRFDPSPQPSFDRRWSGFGGAKHADGFRHRKPLLLDLFCCAGGAGVGYRRADFDVIGVDIIARPNNPLPFIQADAMALDPKFISIFDAIHASPPCRSYSNLAKRNGDGHEWPRLVEPMREMSIASGRPYVIENGGTSRAGSFGAAAASRSDLRDGRRGAGRPLQ